MFLLGFLLQSAAAAAASRSGGPTLVRTASSFGISRPATEIALRRPAYVWPHPLIWERENERVSESKPRRSGIFRDDALSVEPAVTAMPAPSVSFEGLSAANNTAILGGSAPIPPDPNGDVGPGHYVQMVNTLVGVYSKSGTLLIPFFAISDLFDTVGPPCANTNAGDPIVLYDSLADRWLLSQLCTETTAGREHQLVAISTSGDPTGTYFAYDFLLPNDKANDYPHFGVWPDAYYMTNNQFVGSTSNFAGGGAYAFDRAKMLAGDPSASYIYFDLATVDPTIGGELPSDLDGVTLPPVGTPNLFIDLKATEFGDPADALRVFAFHANFADPSSSTFTALPDIALAAFDPRDTGERNAVSQPPPADTNEFLDSLAVQIMHRVGYRTLTGGVQSFVLNFMVNVSGGDPTGDPSNFQAGIRWVELRRNAGTGAVTVNQQGTYAPGAGNGATGRDIWMGSVAQDRRGDIALGFSASSTTLFPSILYAGRLVGDPAGQLSQGEATLQAGAGSQTNPSSRWGDYTAMAVDPADECTFWYTNEYYPTSSSGAWHTRIGAFKFSACTAEAKGTIHGTLTDCESGSPLSGVLLTTPQGYVRSTGAAGTYSFAIAPGTYTITAKRSGYATQSFSRTVAAGGSVTADFCMAPEAVFAAAGSALREEECLPANRAVDPDEAVTMNLCLVNEGVLDSEDVTGTVAPTGGIDFGDSQDFGVLPAGGAPVCRPFRLRASGACGTTAVATLQIDNGGASAGSVDFPIPLGAPVTPLQENLDGVAAPALPAGWTAANASGGSPLWTTTTSDRDTLPNAAFVNDPAGISDKRLTTPSFTIQTANALLTFRQNIHTDEFFDGGVLEISSPNVNGGAFTDVTDGAVGGSFVTGGYGSTLLTGFGNPLGGRAAWTGNSFGFFTTVVDLGSVVAGQSVQLRWRLGSDSGVGGTGWWIDSIMLSDGAACCTVPTFLGRPMGVDEHSATGTFSNMDSVFQPGESVLVSPAWKNTGGSSAPLSGTAAAFTGPPGATYSIADSAADYGTIAAGGTNDCFDATTDCFRLTLSNPPARPVSHWDATFQETLSTGPAKSWTLHIGDSFTDVPRSNPFYRKIETLLHSGITAGCGPAAYCPSSGVPRSQMAIFLARGIAGGGANIPAGGVLNGSPYFCGAGGVSLFSDVSPFDIFCRQVHFIAANNVTQGCAASKFCPSGSVSRAEMALFLARAVLVPGGGASIPLTYGPDPTTGRSYSCDPLSPNVHFTDAPAGNTFCRATHFLWARGVIEGCSATQYCPGQAVTRAEMAKFLANAFGRELYPP